MLAFVAAGVVLRRSCVDGPAWSSMRRWWSTAPDRLRFHVVARATAATPRLDGARALALAAWARTPMSAPTGTARPTRCRPGITSRSRRKGRCGGWTRRSWPRCSTSSARHEARLAPKPAWTRDKMSPGRFEAMLKAIVGFEMGSRRCAAPASSGRTRQPSERARRRGRRSRRRQGRDGGADAGRAMNRLAIFDCDGTLVDSQAQYLRGDGGMLRRGRAARRRPRSGRGGSSGSAWSRRCGRCCRTREPRLHAALAEDYKRAFQRLRARGPGRGAALRGIAELIDALEADGWLLGVATGKSDRGLALCLEHHGLAQPLRHPADRRPPPVQAASRDDRAGDGRGRRRRRRRR